MANFELEELELYLQYFRDQHREISCLPDPLHKKILSVTLISALAEARYLSLGKHKDAEKFEGLIKNEAQWTHADSVNVLHLQHRIIENGIANLDSTFVSDIQRLCETLHGNPSRTIDLSEHPTASALLVKYSGEAESKLVKNSSHSRLLYLYRCKLVHEFREQGHAWEFPNDTEPIYRHGELVYPAAWLVNLIPTALSNLETHYRENQINPHDSYTFGSPWT